MSNLNEFLASYNIEDYERPSVATDIAVFTVMPETAEIDYRKLPQKKLRLLLVRRGEEPFKGLWALPGGFVRKGETVYQAAKRELYEETGTQQAHLEMCGTFDEQGRDPRGWIISQAFMALVNSDDQELMKNIHAGGDADETEWFDISLDVIDEKHERIKDDITNTLVYRLSLNGKENLTAIVEEEKLYKCYHEELKYNIVESNGLGFDHAKIIVCMLNKLKQNIQFDIRTAFDLMPTYFTLTDLQNVFEIILNKELLKPNFRRKIADCVIETDKIAMTGGHRPSKLFKRNMDLFYV